VKVGAESPLRIAVENDELVIRIGINTLAWASDHADTNNLFVDELNDFKQTYKVTDALAFAKGVASVMQAEAEDGSTPVTKLIDAMCFDAIEDGTEGIKESGRGE
jgi:hypothetical protein